MRVLVIQGPNINMLGVREQHTYGTQSMDDIHAALKADAKEYGIDIAFFQSNHEGAIVDRIQAARTDADFIIINPAAYTHTSVAIADAIRAAQTPVIEVHISNVYTREAFRHHSYVSPVAEGVIAGLGAEGYRLALTYIARKAKEQS